MNGGVATFALKSAGMNEGYAQDWAELRGLRRQLIGWAGLTVAILAVFTSATVALHLASWIGQLRLVAWLALVVRLSLIVYRPVCMSFGHAQDVPNR